MTTESTDPTVLVADIGGTFARFRPMRGHLPLGKVLTLERGSAADLPSLCAMARQEFGIPMDGAAIAIAAPVSLGRARMTNAGWDVNEPGLARVLGMERVLLINDFEALALSLPALNSADMLPIPPLQGADPQPGAATVPATRVVFGPGTGLGVAALAHVRDQATPIASEGGHVGFSAATPFEQEVMEHAARQFERVSWERILSGPGLELIDDVSRRRFRTGDAHRDAAQIIHAAQYDSCAAALHSIECFAGLLGSFGGDLALMFRASGGVFIGGGIMPRILPLISLRTIRDRFCRKGRFSSWLAGLSLAILTSQDATLIGAARAFGERFAASGDMPAADKTQ